METGDINWKSFELRWKGWLKERVDPSIAIDMRTIPKLWVAASILPSSENVRAIWIHTEPYLPLFTKFLYSKTIDIRIYSTNIGPVLAYYIKDWRDMKFNSFQDGVMMAGLPTDITTISNFEKSIGILPETLKQIWLTHGFLSRRNNSFLFSLKNEYQLLFGEIAVYSNLQDEWNSNYRHDALLISDGSKQLSKCLGRVAGSVIWGNKIVTLIKWKNTVEEDIEYKNIDEFLTKPEFSDWEDES